MNRAFQMNLGGLPLTIDDDAYQLLDSYLDDLEKHFKHSESREEILSDIESRLAELLAESLKGRDIVTIEDVQGAIKIMGRPNEFDNDYHTEQPTDGGRPWDVKTGKRLFRDPDDQVIGGVCSGVAAYFGIQDPIWVRLGFVVVFLTMGFGLLLYIIMWALVPEAKTAGDRLAMMGEPANAENIANMVERGIEDLSETIKDNWNEFKAKKKSNRSAGADHLRDSRPGWLHVLMLPVYLFKYLIMAIGKLIRKITRVRSHHYYERNPYV